MRLIGEIFGLSDAVTQTSARMNLMNDGLQTTAQLQGLIFQSAQNSRGAYMEMANSVAQLGNLAGNAFDSSAQIVDFTEQISKMFKISGATTEMTNAAMLQLTQSLAKGVLNGDELTFIMENGSMIAMTIADYMGVSTGEMKELAAQGAVTSDVVKNAIFGAANATDAAFANMPQTWGEVWTSFKNNAIIAFQPVLQQINEIANSERFQEFMNNAIGAVSAVREVVGWVLDGVTDIGAVIYDNWDMIPPVIYGAVAAFLMFNGVLMAYGLMMGITNTLRTIATVQAAAHEVATADPPKGQTCQT